MLRVRVSINSSAVAGGPWLYTSYWTGNDSQGGADTARNAVVAFFNSFRAHQHTSVTNTLVTVVDQLALDGTLTGQYVVAASAQAGLVNTSTLLPPATQGLIHWRTGSFIGGRELRGKTFLPGMTEGENVQGVMDGTVNGLILGYANTLRAVANPALGVWSRKSAAISTVSAAQVPTKWAVLRSRKD